MVSAVGRVLTRIQVLRGESATTTTAQEMLPLPNPQHVYSRQNEQAGTRTRQRVCAFKNLIYPNAAPGLLTHTALVLEQIRMTALLHTNPES